MEKSKIRRSVTLTLGAQSTETVKVYKSENKARHVFVESVGWLNSVETPFSYVKVYADNLVIVGTTSSKTAFHLQEKKWLTVEGGSKYYFTEELVTSKFCFFRNGNHSGRIALIKDGAWQKSPEGKVDMGFKTKMESFFSDDVVIGVDVRKDNRFLVAILDTASGEYIKDPEGEELFDRIEIFDHGIIVHYPHSKLKRLYLLETNSWWTSPDEESSFSWISLNDRMISVHTLKGKGKIFLFATNAWWVSPEGRNEFLGVAQTQKGIAVSESPERWKLFSPFKNAGFEKGKEFSWDQAKFILNYDFFGRQSV